MTKPCDTPCEILIVASEGFAKLEAVGSRPVKLLSLADAATSAFGKAGADSSEDAGVFAVAVLDLTTIGAAAGF